MASPLVNRLEREVKSYFSVPVATPSIRGMSKALSCCFAPLPDSQGHTNTRIHIDTWPRRIRSPQTCHWSITLKPQINVPNRQRSVKVILASPRFLPHIPPGTAERHKITIPHEILISTSSVSCIIVTRCTYQDSTSPIGEMQNIRVYLALALVLFLTCILPQADTVISTACE